MLQLELPIIIFYTFVYINYLLYELLLLWIISTNFDRSYRYSFKSIIEITLCRLVFVVSTQASCVTNGIMFPIWTYYGY